MFHKAVWQHMQGMVRFYRFRPTANLPRYLLVGKNSKSVKI